MDVGMGRKRNGNRVWVSGGNLVNWVMATGHGHKRSNKNKCKHGFTNRHTRQKTVTIPLVFQLLTSLQGPRSAQLSSLESLNCSTLPCLSLAMGLVVGHLKPPECHKGAALIPHSTLPVVSLGEVGLHVNIPLQIPT